MRNKEGTLGSTHNYCSNGTRRLSQMRDDYPRDIPEKKKKKRPIWGYGGRRRRLLSIGEVFHTG